MPFSEVAQLSEHSSRELLGNHPIDLTDKHAIVELAALTMNCPFAAISTIRFGEHHVLESTGEKVFPAEHAKALVQKVVRTGEMLIAGSANDLPTFYVGLPLYGDGSKILGVLSLIDNRQRTLTTADRRTLKNLQTVISSLLATYDAHCIAAERQTELHITLENMDQGVTVFDADARLVLWNQRYLEIFEKTQDEVYKGVSLYDLIKTQNLQNGFEGFGDSYHQMLSELRKGLAKGEVVPGGVRLNSGRIISSIHAAMPNGGWVATHSDITERVRAQEKIEHASLHDAMTGLVNRNKFATEFEIRNKNEKGTKSLILMLVDIDRFKRVNDNFGHGAGDAVIMSVADRLRECTRRGDVVARLGGDEFAVLLHMDKEADETMVHSAAGMVVECMREEVGFQGNVINFSVSVGCHEIEAGQSDLEEALSCADFALYKAKQNGRSRYQFFDNRMAQELISSKRMQALVRQDTYAEKLCMNYQPIVCLNTQKDYSFEALIRWDGDRSEYMAPSDIIQAAEQNGSIGSLGNWVLNQALRECKNWDPSLRISVNVSPKQLGDSGFAEKVIQALEWWNVAPERLELEVTETALLQDRASIEELHQIKRLGVAVSLDDFGTGYSSLTLLQRFPFDKLKIDRSFVGSADTDPISHAIVRSVVKLSRDLDVKTVAEGIETDRQLSTMQAMGCNMGQGFLLGKPVDGHKLQQELSTRIRVA